MKSQASKTRSFLFVAINGDELPQWIELIPAGKFSAVDGRGPFDNADPDSIVGASVAKMPHAGLVLDYDHATDLAAPEGRPAPAAGWLKEFKVEAGAILARIEWTTDAADAVKAKKYRYISPVFEHSKDGKVERILRAALTNNPALINLPALASAIAAADPTREVALMAKEDDAKKMKLSEVMAVLEKAYPEAGPEKLMKAAACLMAEDDGDDDGDDDGTDAADAAADPYENENGDQMPARQADEMAKCSSDEEKASMAAKHAAEKDRFAKRNQGLEVKPALGAPERSRAKESATCAQRSASGAIEKMTKEEIDKAVAKHPMVVRMAGDLNQMRAAQAHKTAETAVDTAIREGRLVPSQREWAVEYCSADPQGFEKFIGAQPKILQSGPDGTFTGKIGEVPADQLSQREMMVCENLGVTADKFAAAKKARLSHNVHLD